MLFLCSRAGDDIFLHGVLCCGYLPCACCCVSRSVTRGSLSNALYAMMDSTGLLLLTAFGLACVCEGVCVVENGSIVFLRDVHTPYLLGWMVALSFVHLCLINDVAPFSN